MAMQISIPAPSKRTDLGTVVMHKRLRRLDAGHRANLYAVLRNDAMRRADPTPPIVGLMPAEHVPAFNTARVVAWGAWLLIGTIAALPYLKTLI